MPLALRVRHVRKSAVHWYLLFNERKEPLDVDIEFPIRGARFFFEAATAQCAPWPPREPLRLAGHEIKVALFDPRAQSEHPMSA